MTQPSPIQFAGDEPEDFAATEAKMIERVALRVGMKSLMNHGAASCVYSEGCNGVTQEHLIAFAREIALRTMAVLAKESP